MAVDAAFLIRLGSALLFILLGIAILLLARRRRGPMALAAFLITYAMVTVFTNVRIELSQVGYTSPWLYLGSVPFVVAASVFGFLAAAWLPGDQAGWRGAVGGGMLVGLLAALAMVDYSIAGDATNAGVPDNLIRFRFVMAGIYSVTLAGMMSTSAWRVRQVKPSTAADWIRCMAFNLLLAPGLLAAWPGRFGQPWSLWTLASMVFVVVGLTLPLLLLAVRTPMRAATRGALLWPALGLLSYAYLLLPANAHVGFYDAYGINGVLRILGWTFLVFAILKADLLGVPLPHLAVSRGAVAAGSLAVLFIVAQVAQNFFSAQYGLLTGGVIAGAFLFAASPAQRAFERMGERKPAKALGRRAAMSPGRQQLEAFRGAVRLAWKDRRFDQAEEFALAELADSMGLTATQATAIRHDVEREKGVR
ncbi:MAG: hypothetical protein QOJ26_50 [Thermoplasmata archaeon]|jgi:hypothetical protein|nr:hypothetical protein [Thermoplasmata archaeon]